MDQYNDDSFGGLQKVRFQLPEMHEEINEDYSNESENGNKSQYPLICRVSPISMHEDENDNEQFLSINIDSSHQLDISSICSLQGNSRIPKTLGDLSLDKSQKKVPKKGCSCKKRQCSSLYCWCYKKGLVCSDLCKCQDCTNNTMSEIHRRNSSISIERKGCRCKKNNCLKGYCECQLKDMKCSDLCKCVGCLNKDLTPILEVRKDVKSVPRIKKKIKKYHKNQKGFLRTNRRRILNKI